MGFLSGRVTFDRFELQGTSPAQFTDEHVAILEKFAIGKVESASADEPSTGFLAGGHLFDLAFSLEKNIIVDALQAALRIDTNKVDAQLQKSWLEMELSALIADSPTGKVSRAQRLEAKEAVQARCEEEIATGRFRRMKQTPFLWHRDEGILYCGSSSRSVSEQLLKLFAQAFGLEFQRITAGSRAEQLSAEHGWQKALDHLSPSQFGASAPAETVAWMAQQPESADYLGNEFLLWLWWTLETQSEEITLPDDSVVTAMLNRTLMLECPSGESGKESITAEAPTRLPESHQAIRTGKLPRKAGITLSRNGEQYAFVIQAESLAVTGAAIESTEHEAKRGILEDRIAAISRLGETIDLLFESFCHRRLTKAWETDLSQIQTWLSKPPTSRRRAG